MTRPVVTVDREALEVVLGIHADSYSAEALGGAREQMLGALDASPAPGDVLEADGTVVLLDAMGAVLGAAGRHEDSTAELAVVIDLGGRLNRSDGRVRHRYLATPRTAAELVVAILETSRHEASAPAFRAALDAMQGDGPDA